MSAKGIIFSILAAIALIVVVTFSGRIIENVPADKIDVIQDPVDGELHVYPTQGMKYQNFGTVQSYSKRTTYWFTANLDQGKKGADESIKIRFNDGGHGYISGCVSIELPITDSAMRELHTKYGSDNAIVNELIRPVFEKAVYMSGPLMSSKESYAEGRNKLLSYIEDQALNGVYQTISEEIKTIDQMTGKEKTVTVVRLKIDDKGQILREEESPLKRFKIRAYGLTINQIKYDETVEGQIKEQQKAIMAVQTAMAEAKQAEQRAITEQQNGLAEAAKAKWEEEVIKAKAIVQAEQRLGVAKLDNETAEQRKQENVKLGEGEAARRKLVMQADGALELKLKTYEEVMKAGFEQLGKQKWVPEIQFGGSTSGVTGSSVNQFMELLSAKAAKDLGLDLSVPKE